MPHDDHMALHEWLLGCCPPAIQIEIELEAAPRLTFLADSDEEMDRLLDWINASVQRVDLVALAMRLGDAA